MIGWGMRKSWMVGGLAVGAIVAAVALLQDAPTRPGGAVEQPIVPLPPVAGDTPCGAVAASPPVEAVAPQTGLPNPPRPHNPLPRLPRRQPPGRPPPRVPPPPLPD